MIWAIDQDNDNHDAIAAISPVTTDLMVAVQRSVDRNANAHDTFQPSQCYVTDCDRPCKPDERVMTKTGRNDPDKACPGKRFVCCPSWAAPKLSQCHWARNSTGYRQCAGE